MRRRKILWLVASTISLSCASTVVAPAFCQSSNPKAQALAEAGLTKLKAGDFQGAIETLSQAIKADRKNAALYRDRAAAFSRAGDALKAIQDYDRSIEL